LQALQTATANSAALLGLDDRGVLAAGKLADFVVLTGDPSANPQEFQSIESVWRHGKKVSGAVDQFLPPE
jgi:imidazolonepropionase-like amidohydrolase